MIVKRRGGYPIVLLVFLYLFISISPASAAWMCYDEKKYPLVRKLKQTEKGLVVSLGGKFFAHVLYTPKGEWVLAKPEPCKGNGCNDKKKNKPVIPLQKLSREEAIAMRPELQNADVIEQDISAWREQNGIVWFGLGFYDGEGYSGVGGIGKYDPIKKKVEIRRPELVKKTSVNPIIYDGNSLWFGTYGHYECIGTPPTHGLVQYEWDKDRIETFEGKNNGPCGFLVHDFALQDDYLWVATDLGLSRLDRKKKKWENYIADPDNSPPMRKASCAEVYKPLLDILPKKHIIDLDFEGYFSQLFNQVRTYWPDFASKYWKAMPPD